jgi:archaeosine-15-forming tRNA-guanine transglycosylase
MGGSVFAEALLERVRQARASLETAVAAEDAYLVAVAQDELDDAVRVARRHGVDVDAVTAEAEGE